MQARGGNKILNVNVLFIPRRSMFGMNHTPFFGTFEGHDDDDARQIRIFSARGDKCSVHEKTV